MSSDVFEQSLVSHDRVKFSKLPIKSLNSDDIILSRCSLVKDQLPSYLPLKFLQVFNEQESKAKK